MQFFCTAFAHNPGGSIVGDSLGNTSVFLRWSRAGPPQPFPDVTSGKKIRSSYEVRDSFEKSDHGVGSAAGLECVCGDESSIESAESDHGQRNQTQTGRL